MYEPPRCLLHTTLLVGIVSVGGRNVSAAAGLDGIDWLDGRSPPLVMKIKPSPAIGVGVESAECLPSRHNSFPVSGS